jgi:hypothetical protein
LSADAETPPAAEPALADSKDLFPIIVQDGKHWPVEMKSYLSGFIRISEPHSGFFSGPEGGARYFFVCVCEIEKSILVCAQGIGAGCCGATELTFQRDVRYAPRFEARLRCFRARSLAHCHL